MAERRQYEMWREERVGICGTLTQAFPGSNQLGIYVNEGEFDRFGAGGIAGLQ